MPQVMLLVHTTPGLRELLEAAYEDISVVSVGSNLRLAEGSLTIARTVYIEDTVDNLAAVRNFIALAASRGVRVLLGLHGLGVPVQDDFARTGVSITLEREPNKLVGWIARELGIRRRRELARSLVAVATAKGGAGKTTATVNLAEGLQRRGLKVLIVDGDMANAGLVTAMKVPSGFASYLRLVEDRENDWSPPTMRRFITHHKSGIDLLLGSEFPADRLDFRQPQWDALFAAVQGLEEYDVVLFDTGPDIKKRPFALDILEAGGIVVVPTNPTDEDSVGAWNFLHFLETDQSDLTSKAFLLFIEPEKGVIPKIADVQPMFAERYPRTRFLPTWPRATRQLSLASVLAKQQHQYVCPLDVMPASPFSRAVHRTADALITELGLTVPAPMPAFGFWDRLVGRRRVAALS